MSMYPAIIVWEEPSGHLRFTRTARRPHDGESEGQFVDRIALLALSSDKTMRAEWRRPNVPPSRVQSAKQAWRPAWAAEVYFPLTGEDPKDLAPEVQVRQCLRLVGGNIVVDMPLLRAEYMRLVRLERKRRLLASDGERNRIEEIGTADEKHKLRQYRQALRDLPATVAAELDRLTTPEELESYRPAWPEPLT